MRVAGFQYESGVGAASGPPNANGVLIRSKEPGVRSHAGNFTRDLGACSKESEDVGNNFVNLNYAKSPIYRPT
jgi:hypothetical protein